MTSSRHVLTETILRSGSSNRTIVAWYFSDKISDSEERAIHHKNYPATNNLSWCTVLLEKETVAQLVTPNVL